MTGHRAPAERWPAHRRLLRAIAAADEESFRATAAMTSPWAAALLPRLTRAADHSLLWVAVAAALHATGGRRAKRAARRGLVSIVVTSGLANQVGKRLVVRRRPPITLVYRARRARRVPRSSSFPSGHTASAAAFATAVGRQVPALAIPLGLAAAAVGYSRVYTGVHYPSDVLAGAALGVAVPHLLDRLVPTETYSPVRTPAPQLRSQPPTRTGRGVVAVVNPRAGGGDGAALVDHLRRELPDAAVVVPAVGADLATEFRTAAAGARVLAVGGGDGTVSAGAAAAIEAGIPLLVLPVGTFNHFAVDLGLRGVEDAIAALRAGTAIAVDVGTAAGSVFVNTASLGAYPLFVAARQRREGWLGKPLAAAWAVATVLRTERPDRMVIDGREQLVAMMFIGNCRYQPRGFAPNWRPRLDDGRLDVRLLEPNHRFGALRLAAALLTGRLGRSRLYVEDAPGALTVSDLAGTCALARDGETGLAPPEVRFGKLLRALTVYHRPPAPDRLRLAVSRARRRASGRGQ